MRKIVMLSISMLSFCHIHAQTENADTTKNISTTLDEIVISANKTEETKKNVAQHVQVLTATDIANSQAPSSADLISNAGVVVQKSQHGGGSPILRGFEASRVLLVVDGVRMNNLIYRAGHLQNIVTTDNNSFERVEILYGPSSTIYGSDALGGVIHFYTKKPLLATGDKNSNIKVNVMSRFGTASELTNHLDFNYGTKKFGSLTSFTYSMFDDLMMGKNQNPFYTTSYGERYYYVKRFGDKDSIVKNDNRYLQVGSGYNQYDFMQKFLVKPSENLSHGLNIQYSNSGDVPRYDRLTDNPAGGLSDTAALNSAEWYYGPQMRLLAAYDMNIHKQEGDFRNIHLGLNYQALEESRHNRDFGSNFLTHRVENVNVIGANLDFQKVIKSHNMRFGADMQLNTVRSTATRENIVLDTAGKWDTRYPNGNNSMNNVAAYFSHTWRINEELVLTDGIRLGHSMLKSTIDDTTKFPNTIPAPLPYTTLEQKTPVYSGSLGLIHSPSDKLKLSLLVATGFRVPNTDDLTKVFEPPSGGIIVPNADLKPERTVNYELGITNIFNNKTKWENVIYYTNFQDAAVADSFQYQGQDSILYDGSMHQVYAMQNKGHAYIYGFSSNLTTKLSDEFKMGVMISYTYGRVKNEDAPDTPLDHIPPFTARYHLSYTKNKFGSEFFINYSGWKRIGNYGSGEDNAQYAPAAGMPAWFTVNLRTSYKLHKSISVQAGVDNIFDTQYRVFASGINAPGRNLMLAVRGSF